MAIVRPLKSAPITEAILDFRVISRPEFRIESFRTLKSELVEMFPKYEEPQQLAITFQLIPGAHSATQFKDLGLLGIFLRSADDKLIAQFRKDGFTLNRLRPYTSWDTLFPLAQTLWSKYRDLANPVQVTRVAVRNINQFNGDHSQVNPSYYFESTTAGVAPEHEQLISGYSSRVTVINSSTSVACHIVKSVDVDPGTQLPSVVLDIDAFKSVSKAPGDQSLLEDLSSLRDFKNEMFFGLVREDILRRFE